MGLEIIPQAIVDAKENASFNKIENTEFYPGKAEEILGQVCYKSKNDDVIAIVDPPRAGLRKSLIGSKTHLFNICLFLEQKAIQQLRKIKRINRLVYVSCNPSLAMKNFVDLGRPESKTLHGDMFVPVKAVAVDMFPHTKHCELIICFDRWENVSKQDLDAKKTGPTDQAASEESICKETSVINM